MKSKLLSKRMTRGIVCGLIGVLLLSVSAFAAYGSTSGYGKYKTAVTDLVVNTDNVTCKMNGSIVYDGDEAFKTAAVWKIDGKNKSTHEKSVSSNEDANSEYFYSVIDGTATQFWVEQKTYDQFPTEYDGDIFGLGGYDDKVVKFASLFADTVLGDLKNNVALVDEENGIRSYRLDVSAKQVPALVSSGLDLLLAADNSSVGYTAYDDYDAAFAAYYEKVKGEPLPADYFDKLYGEEDFEGKEAMGNEHDELSQEMDEGYYDIIQNQYDGKVILHVKSDGSYDVYNSYSEYAMAANYGTSDLEAYLGSNAVLDNVVFDFSLDENDRLVKNTAVVRFDRTDDSGKSHKVEAKIALTFSDYGSTEITPLDTGDRVKSDTNY